MVGRRDDEIDGHLTRRITYDVPKCWRKPAVALVVAERLDQSNYANWSLIMLRLATKESDRPAATMKNCVVGIDASRNRSGGARHHLIGLLSSVHPAEFGIERVHVWAYRALLDKLPDASWLQKHSPPELEGSVLRQMWWQRRALPVELHKSGCDILLSTDAGTVTVFKPSVVMSRDMLSYEPGEMQRYGFSRKSIRLLLLRYVQARSLRSARGTIFLTDYASDRIQRFTGQLSNSIVIPHGVGEIFRQEPRADLPRAGKNSPIRCLYVSKTELYKHQWNVIRAIGELRKRGHNVVITLAGGSENDAQQLVDSELALTDPAGEFVKQIGAVNHDDLPSLLMESDVFVFASTCENMPNTLLEGMASGLPIACSKRGPMPEVLRDGGVYFDPEIPMSIAEAIERIISDNELRAVIVSRAKERSAQYSWARCASETWSFLSANAAGSQ